MRPFHQALRRRRVHVVFNNNYEDPGGSGMRGPCKKSFAAASEIGSYVCPRLSYPNIIRWPIYYG